MKNYNEMTKKQIMNEYIELMEAYAPYADRLRELWVQDRITYGALINYDAYDSYGRKNISDMISKASAAKKFSQYINCSTTKFDWTYNIKQLDFAVSRTISFVETQESLEFEQTQKQLLIANGEITYMD